MMQERSPVVVSRVHLHFRSFVCVIALQNKIHQHKRPVVTKPDKTTDATNFPACPEYFFFNGEVLGNQIKAGELQAEGKEDIKRFLKR